MNNMIKAIKETINQKVSELHLPCNPEVNPTKGQISNIKKMIYRATKSENMCKHWNQAKLVVFDTETTGFNPFAGDEIISLSGIVVENGEIRYDQIFDQLVNPYRFIPEQVQELTGITNEMVTDKPNIFEAIEHFLEFSGDAILVAHNAEFDLNFLNVKLRRICGLKVQNPALDTCMLARSLYSYLESHSLDYLIEYFNMPSHGRHTSLGDSVITAQLFQNLKRILIRNKIHTLAELNQYLHYKAYV